MTYLNLTLLDVSYKHRNKLRRCWWNYPLLSLPQPVIVQLDRYWECFIKWIIYLGSAFFSRRLWKAVARVTLLAKQYLMTVKANYRYCLLLRQYSIVDIAVHVWVSFCKRMQHAWRHFLYKNVWMKNCQRQIDERKRSFCSFLFYQRFRNLSYVNGTMKKLIQLGKLKPMRWKC